MTVLPHRLAVPALLLWAAAGACAGGARPAVPTSAASAAAESRLRNVDWRNRSYGIYTLRDGISEEREYEELGGRHDTTEWMLKRVGYVDLTGDGIAEAVVHVDMHHWSTEGEPSRGTDLHVFAAPVSGSTEPVALGTVHSWTIPIIRVLTSGGELTLTLEASDGPCRERWALRPGGLRRLDDPPVCAPAVPTMPRRLSPP